MFGKGNLVVLLGAMVLTTFCLQPRVQLLSDAESEKIKGGDSGTCIWYQDVACGTEAAFCTNEQCPLVGGVRQCPGATIESGTDLPPLNLHYRKECSYGFMGATDCVPIADTDCGISLVTCLAGANCKVNGFGVWACVKDTSTPKIVHQQTASGGWCMEG